MASVILLSPIGWREEWLLEPLKAVKPDHVVMLHSSHKTTRDTARRAAEAIAKTKSAPTVEARMVKPDFDFVAWFKAYQRAVDDFKGADIVVNLGASHGFAIAMGALVASLRGLPCIIFDDDERRVHYASPAILSHMDKLADADRKILTVLRANPRAVAKLSDDAKIPLSTASTSLQRLQREGFVKKKRDGQSITYSLREGVDAFLPSILG